LGVYRGVSRPTDPDFSVLASKRSFSAFQAGIAKAKKNLTYISAVRGFWSCCSRGISAEPGSGPAVWG
jgi:hypothetical protein